MQEQSLPNYFEVNATLASTSDVASTSEAHGLLCGLISTDKTANMQGDMWAQAALEAASENDPVTDQNVAILKQLFDVTKAKLTQLEFDFALLLPDDDSPLGKRAEELGNWCMGYLSGLSLGGVDLEAIQLAEDAQDVLERMQDIAGIDYVNLDISEEDEEAYVEVMEYVRMGVLMIHADLAKLRADASDEDAKDVTIH